MNLNPVAQRHDHELDAPAFNLVAHESNQPLRHAPRILPDGIGGLLIYQVIESKLLRGGEVWGLRGGSLFGRGGASRNRHRSTQAACGPPLRDETAAAQ